MRLKNSAGVHKFSTYAIGWLSSLSPSHLVESTSNWSSRDWRQALSAIRIHGIGAYLKHRIQVDPEAYQRLPEVLRTFLRDYSSRLKQRNLRMLDELGAILAAGYKQGLELVPLKGSLLTTQYYESPALRPMADLDFLVRQNALDNIVNLLKDLGYESLIPDNQAASERHLRFLKPGNFSVIDWDLPHADNPRPVEIHTRLERKLWGDIIQTDLSRHFWRSVTQGIVVGQPTLVIPGSVLLAHLAVHTLDHLMLQSGRAIQLVDLNTLVSLGITPDPAFDPDWVVPPLILAQRCMGADWPEPKVGFQKSDVTRSLVDWAERVPLDGRAGFVTDPRPPSMRTFWVHWERWRPTLWRLQLAYPSDRAPIAVLKHSHAFIRRLISRMLMTLNLISSKNWEEDGFIGE